MSVLGRELRELVQELEAAVSGAVREVTTLI